MPLKIQQHDEMPTLNLTSMIDVLFLLIIFFMVATKFDEMERNIEVDVPQVAQAGEGTPPHQPLRSEEHTSELQSHVNLVCRLLLEKKKVNQHQHCYDCFPNIATQFSSPSPPPVPPHPRPRFLDRHNTLVLLLPRTFLNIKFTHLQH